PARYPPAPVPAGVLVPDVALIEATDPRGFNPPGLIVPDPVSSGGTGGLFFGVALAVVLTLILLFTDPVDVFLTRGAPTLRVFSRPPVVVDAVEVRRARDSESPGDKRKELRALWNMPVPSSVDTMD